MFRIIQNCFVQTDDILKYLFIKLQHKFVLLLHSLQRNVRKKQIKFKLAGTQVV